MLLSQLLLWATPSYSRPQPAANNGVDTDNGVRYGRPNWLTVTPTLYSVVPPERLLNSASAVDNEYAVARKRTLLASEQKDSALEGCKKY